MKEFFNLKLELASCLYHCWSWYSLSIVKTFSLLRGNL